MLRASSFSSIYKPSASSPNYVKPHSRPTYLPQQPKYYQHASSTSWCRADSGSQRSHQTYCRSSAPSCRSPAAAVSASLDSCSPVAEPAARSSSTSSPAEPGPWSLRPDGLDCSVSVCRAGESLAHRDEMNHTNISISSTVVSQSVPPSDTPSVVCSLAAPAPLLSRSRPLPPTPSLWTTGFGRATPLPNPTRMPLVLPTSRTSVSVWMTTEVI